MLHGGGIYGLKTEYDFSVNLNPYPTPLKVREAIAGAVADVSRYPDIEQTAFREAVALSEKNGLKASNIIGGNGASELLVAVLRYLAPKRALLPVPSFYGYIHSLNMLEGCETEEYQLSEERDFEMDGGFIDRITERTDAVIIANPNNPTGRCTDEGILDRIMRRCADTGASVIIDESFLKLSEGSSAKKYIGKIPGLFIISSYTKLFSIPGVRVGYVIADDKDTEKLGRFLPEWNLSVFADAAGKACAGVLMEDHFIRASLEMIKGGREQLAGALRSSGIKVYPSDTNFILVRTERDLYGELQKHGILIRDCRNFKGLGEGYYRIAVKKHEDDLISFLRFERNL